MNAKGFSGLALMVVLITSSTAFWMPWLSKYCWVACNAKLDEGYGTGDRLGLHLDARTFGHFDTPSWEFYGKEKSSTDDDGSRDYLTLILLTALTQIASTRYLRRALPSPTRAANPIEESRSISA